MSVRDICYVYVCKRPTYVLRLLRPEDNIYYYYFK